MEQRIPKIIHFCWFGGNPKPPLVQRCIKSWELHCPDYEIVEWNEEGFDIHSNNLAEEAYRSKKWAFVADYVRGYALLTYGGIYLDTDMELLQGLDALLENRFFIGFETNDTLATGVIGCDKNNAIIRNYLQYYQGKHFTKEGENAITTSPVVISDMLQEMGFRLNGKKQRIADCTLYPKSYFYPTNLGWVLGKFGKETIGVHHYMDSWGRNSALNEKTILSKMRLSMLFALRNAVGTSTVYQIGQIVRNIRR